MTRSVIATHYDEYSELLWGRENQLMLDNDKITKYSGNVGNAEKAEDIGNRGDGITGDAKDKRNIVNNEASSSNERGQQEDVDVVGDGVVINRVLENVEVSTNGIVDDAGN